MQYPLISEYVRAVQDASSNLDKLAHLVPVLDDHGEPYRSSGAFAVVFKMKDEQTGKFYALKCFTEEQEGRAEAYRKIADELKRIDSSYFVSVEYFEKEIFVDGSCEETEFPVLLMDWVEGETLDNFVAKNYDRGYMVMCPLCIKFVKLALWLHSQPFAHGDIKPDNIIVCPNGKLMLVDYDGMYFTTMKAQKSPTIGTKDFSHPLRTVDDFNETIDDFALASIYLSLHFILSDFTLYEKFAGRDRLLFSMEDYTNLKKSLIWTALLDTQIHGVIETMLAEFLAACESLHSNLNLFFECLNETQNNRLINTAVDYCRYSGLNFMTDEYGVTYTENGEYLVKAPSDLKKYVVKEKTKIICDDAFMGCYYLSEISLPENLVAIGEWAFSGCPITQMTIPEKCSFIKNDAFRG